MHAVAHARLNCNRLLFQCAMYYASDQNVRIRLPFWRRRPHDSVVELLAPAASTSGVLASICRAATFTRNAPNAAWLMHTTRQESCGWKLLRRDMIAKRLKKEQRMPACLAYSTCTAMACPWRIHCIHRTQNKWNVLNGIVCRAVSCCVVSVPTST